MVYKYEYVKCRGGHCRDFGVSRSSVEFLNNVLSYGICQAERKDYSLYWHFGNCNHTWEIPKISTRHPQTPIEAIGTQFATFAIQEILKKVLQNTNSGKNWHIDILTYQYWYVKYKGGHYWDFGVSRSTVEFLNNILSVLEVFLFVKRKFSY